MVSAAVEAGCKVLLSEDMQHGFIVRGLTIVDSVDTGPKKRKVRAPMNHQHPHNFARHAGQFLPMQSCRIVGIAKEDLPALGS